MARVLTAYLKRENVPARAALQQAIAALKLPLTLDENYAPFETAGFLPCTLDGEDAGFDLRFKEADQAQVAALSGRDSVLTFKWGGDPREEAAAYSVCAALAKNFDALVKGDGDVEIGFEKLLGKAQADPE